MSNKLTLFVWTGNRSRLRILSRSQIFLKNSFRNFANESNSKFQPQSYSQPDSKIRVRFAPSPTGFLHLGGLRTALYNYLMCKKIGGSFILRIEDTDRTRLVPGAVENIQDSLEWMGLKPDEGPRYGGPFAPYIQSERLDLYKEVAEKLVESGAAYRCYCSPLRLELMRKEAVKNGELPRYDSRCRSLTKSEETEKQNKKEKFVIRLKMDPKMYELKDEVYGPVSLRVDQEGDPILMKSDGFPTYHLANVVDDHQMKISHVLRGIEWQISTPKHLRIYEAMNWTPPRFAHLPLLLNSDGSKLSKRKGAREIFEFKKEGIFPESLINLLVQAGGGFRGGVANTSRLFSLDELINQFDISLVNRNSCQLNFKKLPEYNRQVLKNLLNFPEEKKKFINEIRQLILEKYGTQVDESVVDHVLHWARDRLTNVHDLFASDLEFVWRRKETSTGKGKGEEPSNLEGSSSQGSSTLQDSSTLISAESKPSLVFLTDALEKIPPEKFTREEIAKFLRSFVNENGLDFTKSMHLLRLGLCGVSKGPSVAEMAEILGKEECLNRLNCATGSVRTNTKPCTKNQIEKIENKTVM